MLKGQRRAATEEVYSGTRQIGAGFGCVVILVKRIKSTIFAVFMIAHRFL
jgi:hypothetical protein